MALVSETRRGRFSTIVVLVAWFGLSLLSPMDVVQGFNIDTSAPIFIYHDDAESQFGFTVALHRQGDENMLLVGAPRASSGAFQPADGVERSGAVFKCPINGATSNASSNSACTELILDVEGHEYSGAGIQTSNASGQWLGSTMQTGGPDGTVVVCRPLYKLVKDKGTPDENRSFKGGCFIIGDISTSADSSTTTENTLIPSSVLYYSPCTDSMVSSNVGSRCAFGTSTAIQGDRVVYGATGSCFRNGRIWYTLREPSAASPLFYFPSSCSANVYYYEKDYYFGSAVTFGNFKGDDAPEVVISGPRWLKGYGRVFLYDQNFQKYMTIDDTVLGTYFGYALAVADLNNDGSDDLVIGAPLFTDEERSVNLAWEVGRISIYYNNNQDGFHTDVDVVIGTEVGCRFGHSLAALGDINQDGFNDLAVGAPFCDGGEAGKVFIYHGSGPNVRLNLSPKQVLSPSSFGVRLVYFGFALSAGLDIDGNSYPDLAIGAHQSQTAVLLRTRPVVTTIASISSDTLPINLDITNVFSSSGEDVTGFNVSVCLGFEGNGLPSDTNLEFSYEVVIDSTRQPVNRRAVFEADDQSSTTTTMSITIMEPKCSQHLAYILPSIRDKQTPLTLSVNYHLLEGSPTQNYLAPVLSDTVNTQSTNSVSFSRQCHNSTCYPDLVITASVLPNRLIVGQSDTVTLSVRIENRGEDAFISVLEIDEPEGLFFVSIDRSQAHTIVSCSLSMTSRVCDVGNPIPAAGQISIDFKYQSSVYSTFTEGVNLNLTTYSIDDEKPEWMADNAVSVVLDVFAAANLSLQGAASPEKLIITESDFPPDRNRSINDNIGPLMTHTISLLNHGPSYVGDTTIELLWPSKLQNGDVLLDIESVTMETGDCSVTSRRNNHMAEETILTTFDRVNNITLYTLRADCSAASECVVARCLVHSLAPNIDSVIVISAISRLEAGTTLNTNMDVLISSVELVVSASAVVEGSIYATIPYSPHPVVSMITVETLVQLQYDVREPTVIKPTPIWVYIVASLGGLLILIICVAVLYKVGFFQRKRISPIQRSQLRESVRSRSGTKSGPSSPEAEAAETTEGQADGPEVDQNDSMAGLLGDK